MRKFLVSVVTIIFLAGCATVPGELKYVKTVLENSDEIVKPLSGETPGRPKYCGSDVGANWQEGATVYDVPRDGLDVICWLHDAETGYAMDYKNPFSKVMAWNSASANFTWRLDHQDETVAWAEKWWSARLSRHIYIQTTPENDDYYKLYKPGAKLLFNILYLPFLKKASLLDGALEDLAGLPPRP